MRIVDFRFNAWGGEYDGLYSNYKNDDLLTKNLAKKFGVEVYRLDDFILEGGSIHVDGEGTCMVTKACLLSPGRNPHLSQLEVEETLKIYLGVSKVIWLENGIYQDETNEHVDNIACFIRPGVVALAWTNDKSDPQYKFSSEAYKVLKNERDAKGRELEIIKIKVPKPMYMSKTDAKGIKEGTHAAKARLEGDRLAASYINFYQGEKFVILPGFDVPEDKLAYAPPRPYQQIPGQPQAFHNHRQLRPYPGENAGAGNRPGHSGQAGQTPETGYKASAPGIPAPYMQSKA